MEEIAPETADKISDANEEIVKKKPGKPRLLGTSPNTESLAYFVVPVLNFT